MNRQVQHGRDDVIGNGRAVLAWLLLLSLALRGVLAPGVMPSFTAADPFPITICTPQGMKALAAEPGEVSDTHAHDHAPCLFAAAGFINLGAVAGSVLVLPLLWDLVVLPVAFQAGHGLRDRWIGLARGPPPGRGLTDQTDDAG